MAKYKTPEQIREELRQINPGLIALYEVGNQKGSRVIGLAREGGTSILYDPSKTATKYEIRPIVNGMNLEELFGMKDTVIGQLSLREAVTIAEHAVAATHSPLFIQELEKVIEEIQRKPDFPVGMRRASSRM